MDTRVLKEPRGFMRCIEWLFAIIAFSLCCDFGTYVEYTVDCKDAGSKHYKHSLSYPFKLVSKQCNFQISFTYLLILKLQIRSWTSHQRKLQNPKIPNVPSRRLLLRCPILRLRGRHLLFGYNGQPCSLCFLFRLVHVGAKESTDGGKSTAKKANTFINHWIKTDIYFFAGFLLDGNLGRFLVGRKCCMGQRSH